ncbi:MAG: response regulator [Chitinophagaceae bacterium]
MNDRLKCIMLIDDDEDDNFFHRLVIEESGIAESIKIAESAEDALLLLKNTEFNPELIFLDLNMPRINGLEFLDEFGRIKVDRNPVIVLLTTTAFPFNKETKSQELINAIETKPLTDEKLKSILSRHF